MTFTNTLGSTHYVPVPEKFARSGRFAVIPSTSLFPGRSNFLGVLIPLRFRAETPSLTDLSPVYFYNCICFYPGLKLKFPFICKAASAANSQLLKFSISVKRNQNKGDFATWKTFQAQWEKGCKCKRNCGIKTELRQVLACLRKACKTPIRKFIDPREVLISETL